MSNITLVSLVQKASFQLIDAVYAHQQGEITIDDKALNDVMAKVEDKQQAKVTVLFLFNMVKHAETFDAIQAHQLASISEAKRAELTNEEVTKLAIGKAISTFKTLQKLSGVITGKQAFNFLASDSEIEQLKEAAKAEPKSVAKSKAK